MAIAYACLVIPAKTEIQKERISRRATQTPVVGTRMGDLHARSHRPAYFLAQATYSFGFLSSFLFRWLFKKLPLLHLPKHTFADHLFFQHTNRLIHIVFVNINPHETSLLYHLMTTRRPSLQGIFRNHRPVTRDYGGIKSRDASGFQRRIQAFLQPGIVTALKKSRRTRSEPFKYLIFLRTTSSRSKGGLSDHW